MSLIGWMPSFRSGPVLRARRRLDLDRVLAEVFQGEVVYHGDIWWDYPGIGGKIVLVYYLTQPHERGYRRLNFLFWIEGTTPKIGVGSWGRPPDEILPAEELREPRRLKSLLSRLIEHAPLYLSPEESLAQHLPTPDDVRRGRKHR